MHDYPQILSSAVTMSEPNETISIHKGEFELAQGGLSIKLVGEISFKWSPRSGAKFSGDLVDGQDSFYKMIRFEKVKLLIGGIMLSEVYITKHTISESIYLSGVASGNTVFGDGSIPVESVVFTIPNFRDFLGEIVKDGSWGGRHRLTLNCEDYIITIDRRRDYRNVFEKLQEVGGIAVLCYGEIKRKKGNLVYSDLKALNHALITFLTFLNGSRCSPHFLQGTYNDEVIWTDYSGYFVDPYRSVHSWPSNTSIAGLSEMWSNFYSLWKNENDKDFLNTAIHWYVEANNNAGFAEGSIVMVQTALELIYNWLLVERKKILVGNDAEDINASNKIRLVLSDLGITRDFPSAYSHLKELATGDAPEAFVQIRNAIVHSQQEKRKKLLGIESAAKIEALHLGIWYVELALLKILGYKGEYVNRTKTGQFIKAEPVPWLVLKS